MQTRRATIVALARAACTNACAACPTQGVVFGDVLHHAIVAFAERCADQNVADFDALRHAVASGRVQAVEG